jgi:hypothetical protein
MLVRTVGGLLVLSLVIVIVALSLPLSLSIPLALYRAAGDAVVLVHIERRAVALTWREDERIQRKMSKSFEEGITSLCSERRPFLASQEIHIRSSLELR